MKFLAWRSTPALFSSSLPNSDIFRNVITCVCKFISVGRHFLGPKMGCTWNEPLVLMFGVAKWTKVNTPPPSSFLTSLSLNLCDPPTVPRIPPRNIQVYNPTPNSLNVRWEPATGQVQQYRVTFNSLSGATSSGSVSNFLLAVKTHQWQNLPRGTEKEEEKEEVVVSPSSSSFFLLPPLRSLSLLTEEKKDYSSECKDKKQQHLECYLTLNTHKHLLVRSGN